MPRPFIPAPNTASVELIYSCRGITMENVFHVQGGAPFDLAGLQAVRAVFVTWYTNYYRAYISSNASLVRVRSIALDVSHGVGEDFALSPPVAGGWPDTAMPLGVTIAVSLRSGLTGRSTRGRIYVPAIGRNMTTGDAVDVTSGNNLRAAVAQLITALPAADATWKLVITSYRTGGAWRPTAVNYAVTAAVLVDYNLDSQRRRLAGRGRT